ncbi:MAG: beta-N-acetylhexosaminidase [Clostridia bacterium]|nr:beta-N-acetylhexosaminidase [Clostridia bacterium]
MAKRFGVMIDASRNAVMKPEEVKSFATLLKKMGYNMIQLYTEDTYEIPEEPYFGYLRGRYTHEELKDIVSFCHSIGMEVIPNIQTLAHLSQIFRWEEYTPIRDTDDILLVGDERTYALIENMFKTLRECFTSEYVHIGMDEAHMLGLGKYKDIHGIHNRFEIIYEHLLRVIEIAKKYGFKPLIWSDMFFRLANAGQYYLTDPSIITDEVVAACPDGVDPVYWDYYSDKYEVYDTMLTAHEKFKGETWFAGGAWTWRGFVPDNRWSLKSMEPAMRACAAHGVDNIFITLWGDNGRECSPYAVLPSLFAIRKFHDGVTDMETIKTDFKAVTGEDFDTMMLLDMPESIELSKRAFTKYMTYNDPLLGYIDVLVKDGGAQEYGKIATKLAAYSEVSPRPYLFSHFAALADFLAIKYDLGVKTRNAYQSNDKNALAALLSDYDLAADRLRVMIDTFRTLWYKENKPHGFEIQEARLGGLLYRLTSAKNRLSDYLNGTVDSLPELEETLLPLPEKLLRYTWDEMISTSRA